MQSSTAKLHAGCCGDVAGCSFALAVCFFDLEGLGLDLHHKPAPRRKSPWSPEARLGLLRFALETRNKIREVRQLFKYLADVNAGDRSKLAEGSKLSIAKYREGYRRARKTFESTDVVLAGHIEELLDWGHSDGKTPVPQFPVKDLQTLFELSKRAKKRNS